MAVWKKIILKDDDAQLAQVTASQVNLGANIPEGDTSLDVLVIDDAGNVKKLAQSSVQGSDTTYAAGTSLTISAATFSVVQGNITHSQLGGYVENEHIDWTLANQGPIHTSNYTDNTYTGGDGIDISDSNVVSTSTNQGHVTQVGALTAGSIGGAFGTISTGNNITTTATVTAGTANVSSLNTDTATVTTQLTAGSIVSPQVEITGSLTVNGSLIYNDTAYSTTIAQTTTGSTIWGDSDDDTHYFSGSVNVSGQLSASSFVGNGSQITGLTAAQANNSALSDGSGIVLADYDGTSAQEISVDTYGTSITSDALGLYIGNNDIDTQHIADFAITNAKIASGAISSDKLNANMVAGLTYIGTDVLTGAYEILSSTGDGSALGKVTLTTLASFVSASLDSQYSDNTGTVTSVQMGSNTTVSGITLAVTNGTGAATMSLTGNASINNANWSSGQLSIANGGTGESTRGAAANALLNGTLGGGTFNIGDASDNITIPGDLTVAGAVVSINTTNLEITDKFILIGSGSTTSDIGIQFGETVSKGNTLFWDKSYGGAVQGGDANDGRFAIGHNVNSSVYDSSTNADFELEPAAVAYHLAGVYSGSDPQTNNAEQIGNIKLDAGAAYIYA
tara:strand:- start:369 stop:2234 length:1866 start_codon:yes stop_codon:yes gene_type:complete